MAGPWGADGSRRQRSRRLSTTVAGRDARSRVPRRGGDPAALVQRRHARSPAGGGADPERPDRRRSHVGDVLRAPRRGPASQGPGRRDRRLADMEPDRPLRSWRLEGELDEPPELGIEIVLRIQQLAAEPEPRRRAPGSRRGRPRSRLRAVAPRRAHPRAGVRRGHDRRRMGGGVRLRRHLRVHRGGPRRPDPSSKPSSARSGRGWRRCSSAWAICASPSGPRRTPRTSRASTAPTSPDGRGVEPVSRGGRAGSRR